MNRYDYNREGLYIPYALANFLTLVAVISALVSYKMRTVLPDTRFDNIVSAAENPDLIHLIRNPNDHSRQSIRTTTRESGQFIFGVSTSHSTPLLGSTGLSGETRSESGRSP